MAGGAKKQHKLQALTAKDEGLNPKPLNLKVDESGGDDPIHDLISEEWRQGVTGVTEEGELEGLYLPVGVYLCVCVCV
jgi:hypothetical protein